MELNKGSMVKYTFPEPVNNGMKEITGEIETVADSFITLVSDSKIKLKISFKNFDYISLIHEGSFDFIKSTN